MTDAPNPSPAVPSTEAASTAAASTAIRPLHVGPRTLENNLVVAPLAGVSNLPFRLIAREAGASVAFTETVSAKGLVRGGPKTWRLLRTSTREAPVAFQLFGSDPLVFREACQRLDGEGAVWIDLNLGCPVKKFIKNGAGSALLRDVPRAAAIVREIRRAFSGTVTVKMRAGWDTDSINAPEVARAVFEEGAEMVSVHGRTRAQLYAGRADRGVIRRVVDAVPEIPVLANGDIVKPEDVFETLAETGAAGVMIGRGAMGNPWIFQQTLAAASGSEYRQPTREQRWATIQRHVDLMSGLFEKREFFAAALKKYLAAYSKGLPGSAAFRQVALEATDLDVLLHETRRFFADLHEAA